MSSPTPTPPDAPATRAAAPLVSVPADLLWRSLDVVERSVVPRWLGARDDAWLGALLEQYALYVGQPKVELAERLRQPLRVEAPRAKLRLACAVLDRLTRGRATFQVPPRRCREVLFEARAGGLERERALERAARELGLPPLMIEAALFADLPHEARVAPLTRAADAAELALEVNLALASSLLGRARQVRLSIQGGARSVVRHVQRRGLICNVVRGSSDGEDAELDISGPFSLFRHTTVYARHLASLVPGLGACREFRLVALCVLGSGREQLELTLSSNDPLPAGREPAPVNDRVRERFARDFARLESDWQLVREPEPVWASDGSLLFADFALVHREQPGRSWLLEIVGFWTRDHIQKKLSSDASTCVVLCVDADRGCRDEDLPEGALVVRYRRKIDVGRVLAAIDADQASAAKLARTAASMSGP